MAYQRDEEVREQFAEVPIHRLPPREPWEKVLGSGRLTKPSPITRTTWPQVIGITGRKRHGKNTAADGLVEFGYEVVGFADELKQMLYELNPKVGATFRLQEVVDTRGWEYAKEWFPETRRLLQVLGTEVIRSRQPNFWLDIMRDKLASGRKTVIADVRFDNEAELIHSFGGIVVEVVRPNMDDDFDTHASEAGVDRGLVDIVLVNHSTPVAIQRRLVRYLTEMFPTKETQ